MLIGWKENISGVTEYKQDDANTTEINNPPPTINTGNAEEHVETFTWTDSKGYTFEAQLHMSPWFLQSDKSAIAEFLSKNKYNISAPTLDNWEIKSTGSSQFRKENGRFIDENSVRQEYMEIVLNQRIVKFILGMFCFRTISLIASTRSKLSVR